MKYVLFRSFFVLFSLLILSSPLQAQFNEFQTTINVEMIPTNPGPNEKVVVSVVSYSTNIDAANFTWRVNGKVVKTGRGEKVFTFTTGDFNTTTTLTVSVTTMEGETITQTYYIKPAQIDILWQTESFTPPFYKGKALFSHQNKITFIAIPHLTSRGVEISAKNLIYKWSKNGTVIDSASGYGKNTYTFVSPLISRGVDVSVEVSSSLTGAVGRAEASINPIEPDIVFYKKNPLYGIEFQNALSATVSLTDSKEILIVGMPFYFGTLKSSDSSLNYKWAINGKSINNNLTSNVQVFRQEEGTSGQSNISLSVENTKKVLQFATTNFNLKFGNP